MPSSTVHHTVLHYAGTRPAAPLLTTGFLISPPCLYSFTTSPFFCLFAFFLRHALPPVHRLFVFLPLSCFPSPYSYPPCPLHLSLLDSISLDNEGMIQLSLARCSDQSASVFPSDCACVLRLDPAASNATEAGMSVRIALCSL